MAIYMRVIPKGIDGLVITDTSGSESGELTQDAFSEKLNKFYTPLDCTFESQRIGSSLKCWVKKGQNKLLEIVVSPGTHERHEERRDGDRIIYYTHRFLVRFRNRANIVPNPEEAFKERYG